MDVKKCKKWCKYCIYRIKYNTIAPNPNKIIRIKPSEVKWVFPYLSAFPNHHENILRERRDEYIILSGNWDLYKKNFWQELYPKSLTQRFVYDYDWEETDMYERFQKLGRSKNRFYSRARKDERLYESMKKNGFDDNHPVSLHIGRNGELIREDGFHRITIAAILGIDEIPAKILIRHSDWQNIREAFAEATTLSDLNPRLRCFVGHPDLEDFI